MTLNVQQGFPHHETDSILPEPPAAACIKVAAGTHSTSSSAPLLRAWLASFSHLPFLDTMGSKNCGNGRGSGRFFIRVKLNFRAGSGKDEDKLTSRSGCAP
eukprot:CAMPEP_0206425462 /NCGR_PEP_ID=MMETSP0324_2-20121206/3807_1 /ASSEMBLY_ACC=CAM_ASM_000836 /TAXON_ID=2866 /ORGANISM="Crypthecodinium cohnii, Strain Seligo" /LENGTH=100 /DNA_ID=CAMNT_0053890251 /DNA_START=254 /DNA_END=557 /DNA_ORIENTATION=+